MYSCSLKVCDTTLRPAMLNSQEIILSRMALLHRALFHAICIASASDAPGRWIQFKVLLLGTVYFALVLQG